VGAGGGVVEQAVDRPLHRVGDDVLPLAGLDVGVGPRQPEDVGEQALGQPVAADNLLGQPPAVGREVDGRAVDRHEALDLHALDHLGHRRPGDVQPLGDPCLDDVDVVFLQLPDRLAILLERGVKLGSLVLGHGASLQVGIPAGPGDPGPQTRHRAA
jgi:hypothetical protein